MLLHIWNENIMKIPIKYFMLTTPAGSGGSEGYILVQSEFHVALF